MNLYDIMAFEKEIDRIAAENEGEIPEEALAKIVEAEMRSVEHVENLCKYLRTLELAVDMCDNEIARIDSMRSKTKNRIAGIKKYMTPFVSTKKGFQAGTFKLSTRVSKSVEVDSDFSDPNFGRVVATFKPDKVAIKKAIESGETVEGARLVERENLHIK